MYIGVSGAQQHVVSVHTISERETFPGRVQRWRDGLSLPLSSSSSFFGTMVRRSEATLRMIPISLCVSFGWHFDECLVVISMQPGRNWCCNPNNGLFYCHTVEIVRRFTGNSWKLPMMDSSSQRFSWMFSRTPQYLRREFVNISFSAFFFLRTNLTSLACIIRIVKSLKWDMYKAERYIRSPLNFNVILFNTFCPEWTCRVGRLFQFFFFFTILSAQFIYVWKKMNRVGARACNGDDRCPLDERNFADARIFSSFNKHSQLLLLPRQPTSSYSWNPLH